MKFNHDLKIFDNFDFIEPSLVNKIIVLNKDYSANFPILMNTKQNSNYLDDFKYNYKNIKKVNWLFDSEIIKIHSKDVLYKPSQYLKREQENSINYCNIIFLSLQFN